MYAYGDCRPETDNKVIDGVLEEFLRLCDFPHASGRTAAIADYLQSRLKQLGASSVQRDPFNNLVADFSAVEGFEQAPLVILQGHIDMVCAVKKGSGFRPEIDGIIAVIRGDNLQSDGRSSLGADCGLGVAVVLYLLRQKHLPRGSVRLLFTSDEEIGLVGAQKLDDRYLQNAKYLINTDGFHLGDVVISSASGRRESYVRKPSFTKPTGKRAYRILLDGFAGGHSGYDIGKNRANAIKLMSIFLGELRDKMPFGLALFNGGVSHNAIPYRSEAVIEIREEDEPILKKELFQLHHNLMDLYSVSDPGGFVKTSQVEMPLKIWTNECRDAVLDLCILIYNGVFSTNPRLPGKVDSSSNLGWIGLDANGCIEIRVMVRCSMDAREDMIAVQHSRAASMTGFVVTVRGYKGWPMQESPLAQKLSRIYRDQTGKPLHITTAHIGLETSAFYQKNPNLQIVSIGTDIINPHSLDEHVPVSKIPPYVKLLWAALIEIGKEELK